MKTSSTISKLALILTLIELQLNFSNCEIIIGDSPQVETANGMLEGKWMTSRNGRKYAAFEGIPYANITERFQPPAHPTAWSEIKDATGPGLVCPQFEVMSQQFIDHDDNCLFANIYVPMNDQGTAPVEKILDVFFWIHGGGYVFGAGSFEGGNYMMDENLILITINYRLGSLGFLSFGQDKEGLITQNNGLRDMIEALKWTQINIQNFNGNPEGVTIAGESAGSGSVHALMLSPEAHGLFQKAIAQSGTLLCPWATQLQPLLITQKWAGYLNCTQNGSWVPSEVLECLNGKTMRELLEADLFIQANHGLSFAPTIDPQEISQPDVPSILPDTPRSLISMYDNNNAKVPLIMGHNKDEGLGTALGILKDPKIVQELNENWNTKISALLGLEKFIEDEDQRLKLAGEMKILYFGQGQVSDETVVQLTNLHSDFFFIWGVRETVIAHAEIGALVWPYVLTYPGNFSIVNLENFPTQGVSHADDLQYLFDSTMTPQNWPALVPQDVPFSENFVSMWSTFARTGAPVSWGEKWMELNSSVTSEVKINLLNLKENPQMEQESDEMTQRMTFWTKVLNSNYNNSGSSLKFNWFTCTLTLLSLIVGFYI